MCCLLFFCLLLLIGGHFSELSFPGSHTPKRRARHHSPFRSAPTEKRKIPAQNDRAATNPTQNPSTNVLVSFQINSNAIRGPAADAKRQFCSNNLRSQQCKCLCTHSPRHTTVENTIFVLSPGCPRVKSTEDHCLNHSFS